MREIVLATLKAGTGQVATLLCGAISGKVLAVMIGPTGVGLFSLLRQIQQMLSAIASLGGQTAVVQGMASHYGAIHDKFVASVFWIFLIGIAVVAMATAAFADTLAASLLSSDQAFLIHWITFPVATGTLLIFFRGLLTAHMEIASVAWVNIAVALGSILFVLPAAMAYNVGHKGALIVFLASSLGLGLFLAAHQARAQGYFPGFGKVAFVRPEWTLMKDYFRIAVPSLVAIIIGMGSVLLVRAMVVRGHGLSLAGQFDAAWAISAMYLTMFLAALQTYLLPALSGNRDRVNLEAVLHQALHLSAISAVPLITILIVLKPLAVQLLYSSDFIPALELLRWTLLGDYLRVAGWVLATTLIARADMKAYLVCEVTWTAIFVTIALWLLPTGIAGIGPAYVTAYGVYLGLLVWRIYGNHALRIRTGTIIQWLFGAGIVLLAGTVTWPDVTVSWISLSSIFLAVAYSWFVMAPKERGYLINLLRRKLGR